MTRSQYSVRAHLALALLAGALLVLGFGAWAGLTRINSAVIGTGQLEAALKRQVVQHLSGGIVESIHVAEGDSVGAGDILLRLDGSQLVSELAVVESRLFDLLARRARLEAERDNAEHLRFAPELHAAMTHPDHGAQIRSDMAAQTALLSARRKTLAGLHAQLQQRQVQIKAQVAGIAEQIHALDRQLALLEAELAAQEALLDQGLTQAARVLALERETARLEGYRGALAAERAVATERHAEVAHQIIALGMQRTEEAHSALRQVNAQEMELRERRRALKVQIARLDLRAPVAGIVHGLQVTTPQAVLRAAEPALYIVPQDRPPVIAARVAPADIDQVTTGQLASIHLPALDLRGLPRPMAEVVHVSADAFTDTPDATPAYRVELAFLDASLAQLPVGSLLPGMPVEVFLQTGAQSPWRYLTRPLTSYFSRALRER